MPGTKRVMQPPNLPDEPVQSRAKPAKAGRRKPCSGLSRKPRDAEIAAELPARFAAFMERSTPSEKQVLLLIFRERCERRRAFRLQRALARVVRKLELEWRERRSGLGSHRR